CFYSIFCPSGVVSFARNQVVSFPRNRWSVCAGIRWSISANSPPPIPNEIKVFACKNIKRFGWTLNRVFYYCNNGSLPKDFFVFVKENISIFKDYDFDISDYQKSLVYKYCTENPGKGKNH
ncbi:MAG: hypothetical protein JWR05_379, partial [Mucilaginibacter sp.]|nr:hypothetical protein [Mucilaginibacter sp.]